MKEKIKKFFAGNGSLTLLSILSLIIVFVVVCSAVLAAFYRAGVIDSPFAERTAASTVGGFIPSGGDGNGTTDYSEINVKKNMEKLLSSFPYQEDFFSEFYITHIYESSYSIDFYRVYKHGEKYRIEIFDAYENMKKKIVCDGMNVAVTDYVSLSSEEYTVTDEFTFEKQVPLPSFILLGSEMYGISEYSESNGKCTVKCDFPSLSMYDIVVFDMSTGIMEVARTYFNDSVVMFYDIKEFDIDYLFNELLFLT